MPKTAEGKSMDDLWYQFDASTRTLYVNPEYYAYIQERCRIESNWPDRLVEQFGPGAIGIRVVHIKNPSGFTGLPISNVDLARPGGDMTCKATFERFPDGTLILNNVEFKP
jgi:hypothetical protein